MPLPYKIDPDLLKDSIVEVRFNSQFDFALIPGLVYNHLIEGKYTYAGANFNPVPQVSNPLVFNVAQPTFLNENITCRVMGNSLAFNCNEKYIGWDKYFVEIKNFLKIFDSVEVVTSYSRIGLRYINILQSVNIYEKLIDDLRVNLKSFPNTATNIKTEILDEKFKIVVNLGNDFLQQGLNNKVSVLDIDVFLEQTIDTYQQLIDTLEQMHKKEKEIFFGFLKADFIETLKPTYNV